MAAGLYSLTGASAIERGANYSFTIDINSPTGDYPISGYGVSGFITRKWDNSPETNWFAEILSPASGVIQLSLTPDQTSGLSLAPLQYETYLYPPSGGSIVRILYGDIMVLGGYNEQYCSNG